MTQKEWENLKRGDKIRHKAGDKRIYVVDRVDDDGLVVAVITTRLRTPEHWDLVVSEDTREERKRVISIINKYLGLTDGLGTEVLSDLLKDITGDPLPGVDLFADPPESKPKTAADEQVRILNLLQKLHDDRGYQPAGYSFVTRPFIRKVMDEIKVVT